MSSSMRSSSANSLLKTFGGEVTNFFKVDFGAIWSLKLYKEGGLSSANIINQGGSTYANRLLTRGEGGSKNPSFMLNVICTSSLCNIHFLHDQDRDQTGQTL